MIIRLFFFVHAAVVASVVQIQHSHSMGLEVSCCALEMLVDHRVVAEPALIALGAVSERSVLSFGAK